MPFLIALQGTIIYIICTIVQIGEISVNIIVDTSIIIAVILNEKSKKNIIRLTEGTNLFAPASLHWEIGNAFSAIFKRKRLKIDKALKALKYYREIPIRFTDIDLEPVLEIAHKYKIYAYDAYFIAAAKELNAPLISLDNTLLEIAQKDGQKTIEVKI
jgi:predicted nucleic acid-binding protein